MKQDDILKIKGYLSIIQDSNPNGRYVHEKLNRVASLRMHERLAKPISKDEETKIKSLIHKLYP